MKMKLKYGLAECVVVSAAMFAWGGDPVIQTARDIPVIRDADVVVVGGGSAAVAAAIAAKTQGASVFLVAPRAYLGDDLAGTRELWVTPVPEFFSQPLVSQIFTLNVPFSYTTSIAADPAHSDNGGKRLIDGVKYDAAAGSVQFNNNVAITLALAGTGTVTQLDLYYYYRAAISGPNPFDTVIVGLESSADGSTWSSATISVVTETLVPEVSGVSDATCIARVTVSGGIRAKYLRLVCNRAAGVTRQMLDELVVHTSLDDPIPGSNYSTTPLALKRSLERALEEAGIPFLGGSPVCDVLKDADGAPAGVVLANRKGRQAVTARAVVDATENAWPAQRAGAAKTAFTPGEYSFSRIVIADATNAPAAPGLSVYTLPSLAYQTSVTGVAAPAGMPASVAGRVYRCTFTTNLVSGSMLELLEVEQAARDLTWTKTCIDQADRLTWLPPDIIVGEASEPTNVWPGAASVNLDAFRPQNVPYLYVLGVRADVSRPLAQAMSNPARLMALADRIGVAAAAAALARGSLTGVVLPADTALPPDSEAVHELLGGLPPVNTHAQGTVAEGLRDLPVLAECEVLVIGAGTAGAPAAIAAGRAGVDTIAIDFLYNMGGVQTDGRIGNYWYGNVCGFTANDVDPGWKATGAVLAMAKAEWYRQACRAAGVRVLFGTLAAGAIVETTIMKGVVVILPDGQRGVIRAQTVVDATGNADIAATAGEETEFITASEPAVQGAGVAPHVMGNSYSNTDVGFVDTTDAADIFFFARRAHASMSAATWDAGQNPASRERRRLKGVVSVSPIDIFNNRTYPDTIVQPRSDFDSHGFTVHDLFFVLLPVGTVLTANVPFRALLPKTLDGLLVTGIGISAHRDAMPILRMQPDVQNQGYAAGYASALAVQGSVSVRHVDIAALQAHLVDKGIIDAAHTNTVDSFPLAPSVIQSAVEGLTNNYATLHTVLADTNAALPLLRAAYAAAPGAAARLVYAHVLGLLYDSTGAETLINKVRTGAWDTGWNFQAPGRSVSLMDSYIIALGRTFDPHALAPVLAKAALFDNASAFSHVRAVSMALENLGGGSSVDSLSRILEQMRGYALTNALVAPPIPNYSNAAGDAERNLCLKELSVARALYRVGDNAEGSGAQVLTDYAFDPREVYASHARQVLAESPTDGASDGVWIGTAASAVWDSASNWQAGTRAGGYGSAAYFTNAVAGTQTVSLEGRLMSVGSLTFSGADRIVSNGVLDISGPAPEVTVAAGSRALLAADVIGMEPVSKKGEGKLVFASPVTLGALDVAAGDVGFSDPDIRFFQAYASDPSEYNKTVPTGNPMALRTDFRVNRAVAVTHLGAYDSGGDGFENFMKVFIFPLPRVAGTQLAALAFVVGESYPLENGYRFRKLPEPLWLQPGDYAVVTYGFIGAEGYIRATQEGDKVGTLDDGDGALTFLPEAFYTQGGFLVFPYVPLTPQSEYAATAGSFRFATGATVKNVTGAVTLSAASTLDVAALDMRLTGGLLPGAGGLGTVSNASAAYPVTLTLGVPAGQTNEVAEGVIGDRSDGPLTLVKAGTGTLKLLGPLDFSGGLVVKSGVLEIDSPETLGQGHLTFGTGGKLAPQAGGTLDKMVYVPNQVRSGNRSTRLVARSGSTITLTRGIEVPRNFEFGGFAIQPHDDVQRFSSGRDDGVPLTSVVFDGARLGYLDLYLLGDALPGTGRALHYWKNVRGGLRKLACGLETVDGCDVVFGEGCDFSVDWFDMAGSNAVVSITNNAVIQSRVEVRFLDGNRTQLSLDGGMLQVNRFGGSEIAYNFHLSLKPVLFNGTVVQAARSTDTFVNLSEVSAAPLIRNGGAIFDSQSYEVAIRGKGFAQDAGSTGAFVKLGSGLLKIAAPMTYTGPTLVSNGTLRLDFALWNPMNAAQNLLSPAAEVRVSAGASFEVLGATNAAGVSLHSQTLDRLGTADAPAASLRVERAALSVSALEGAWTKTGSGELAIMCRSDHSATFTGALSVQEGTFAVRGWRTNVTVNVPYPSFESVPLLPDGVLAMNMHVYGAAATGCPGWTFHASDAGYQRNKSNFSSSAETTDALTTNGVQTALLRRNSWMETTLTFPIDGIYTLRFIYCARCAAAGYTNHVVNTYLGGVLKDTLNTAALAFTERVVPLGYVTAGTRVLRLTGNPAGTADPCTLIDDIRITSTTDTSGASALSSDTSSLTLASGVQAELDYPGSFSVGDLVINGTHYRGGYYGATTHPDVFTGIGTLHAKTGGTVLILR